MGAAAGIEKCALRPCRQTREGIFGYDTERSAASDPRDLGAQALRRRRLTSEEVVGYNKGRNREK